MFVSIFIMVYILITVMLAGSFNDLKRAYTQLDKEEFTQYQKQFWEDHPSILLMGFVSLVIVICSIFFSGVGPIWGIMLLITLFNSNVLHSSAYMVSNQLDSLLRGIWCVVAGIDIFNRHYLHLDLWEMLSKYILNLF